jgi:hypothetical protein
MSIVVLVVVAVVFDVEIVFDIYSFAVIIGRFASCHLTCFCRRKRRRNMSRSSSRSKATASYCDYDDDEPNLSKLVSACSLSVDL